MQQQGLGLRLQPTPVLRVAGHITRQHRMEQFGSEQQPELPQHGGRPGIDRLAARLAQGHVQTPQHLDRVLPLQLRRRAELIQEPASGVFRQHRPVTSPHPHDVFRRRLLTHNPGSMLSVS